MMGFWGKQKLPPPPKQPWPNTICKPHGTLLTRHQCGNPRCTWASAKCCRRTWQWSTEEHAWIRSYSWDLPKP
jgi:hypothetical protein